MTKANPLTLLLNKGIEEIKNRHEEKLAEGRHLVSFIWKSIRHFLRPPVVELSFPHKQKALILRLFVFFSLL